MPYETLLVERKDHITTVTLNRPKSKNAMNPQMHFDMCDALAWETAKWTELDAMEKKTWHKGVKQFKEERSFRPGLETYKWKE